jgi:hypothetical protein
MVTFDHGFVMVSGPLVGWQTAAELQGVGREHQRLGIDILRAGAE